MWRYTNIVYIRSCLVLTYIEIFFSIVCCFFSHICWSVNCISWASKFRNFFLNCSETEARFIFEVFMYCPLWKLRYLFSYFDLVGKLFKGLFQLLSQSANCISWVSESCKKHISKISRSSSINLHLRPCSVAIYGKFCTVCTISDFFFSFNCTNLVYKLCITYMMCQDTQTLFILECV